MMHTVISGLTPAEVDFICGVDSTKLGYCLFQILFRLSLNKPPWLLLRTMTAFISHCCFRVNGTFLSSQASTTYPQSRVTVLLNPEKTAAAPASCQRVDFITFGFCFLALTNYIELYVFTGC